MKPRILIIAMLFILGSLPIHGVSAQTGNQSTKYFCDVGRIVAIDQDMSGVKITHQAIEGYMPAMSMHFKIEGDDVLGKAKVGDSVRFTLRDTPELTRLIYIEKIAAKPPQRRQA